MVVAAAVVVLVVASDGVGREGKTRTKGQKIHSSWWSCVVRRGKDIHIMEKFSATMGRCFKKLTFHKAVRAKAD